MEQPQTSPELLSLPAVPSSTISKPAKRTDGTQERLEATQANPRARKKANTVEEKAAENQRKRNRLRQAKEDAVKCSLETG